MHSFIEHTIWADGTETVRFVLKDAGAKSCPSDNVSEVWTENFICSCDHGHVYDEQGMPWPCTNSKCAWAAHKSETSPFGAVEAARNDVSCPLCGAKCFTPHGRCCACEVD